MADMQQPSWRDLYREAVMEPDPEQMRDRIAVAYRAIRTRIAEVRQDHSAPYEEKARLDCAVYFLHLLQGIAEKKMHRPRHETKAA